MIGVRGILPPGLPRLAQILLQLLPPKREQRPNNLAGDFSIIVFDENPRINPAQSAQPGPASRSHQHGLGLIVERVGGDDLVQTRHGFGWRGLGRGGLGRRGFGWHSAFSAAILRSLMNRGFSPRGGLGRRGLGWRSAFSAPILRSLMNRGFSPRGGLGRRGFGWRSASSAAILRSLMNRGFSPRGVQLRTQ